STIRPVLGSRKLVRTEATYGERASDRRRSKLSAARCHSDDVGCTHDGGRGDAPLHDKTSPRAKQSHVPNVLARCN
ncbi:MAG TPA: hypothetical protein VGY54_07090, partial [Polyangiaceae bacterium]|nr:hypothetical protein [Polyangiaceae bacterium]